MQFTVGGSRVTVAEFAKPGTAMDEISASYANRAYRDLIRSRVNVRFEKAAKAAAAAQGVAVEKADLSKIDVQTLANEAVKAHEFEVLDLDGERTVDPVERLAITLATTALRAYCAAEGKALPSAKELDSHARDMVANNPKFLAKAKQQLAAIEKDAAETKASMASYFK